MIIMIKEIGAGRYSSVYDTGGDMFIQVSHEKYFSKFEFLENLGINVQPLSEPIPELLEYLPLSDRSAEIFQVEKLAFKGVKYNNIAWAIESMCDRNKTLTPEFKDVQYWECFLVENEILPSKLDPKLFRQAYESYISGVEILQNMNLDNVRLIVDATYYQFLERDGDVVCVDPVSVIQG
jgi:hypothetical protein